MKRITFSIALSAMLLACVDAFALTVNGKMGKLLGGNDSADENVFDDSVVDG